MTFELISQELFGSILRIDTKSSAEAQTDVRNEMARDQIPVSLPLLWMSACFPTTNMGQHIRLKQQ
jgi:hypothetical protein